MHHAVRQNKLLTMAAPKKVSKRLMSQKQKEMKQVNKCLRQRLAWCNRTGATYDPTKEQYSMYPRAIATEMGYPVKGSKSVWKDKLKKRYPGQEVVIDVLPSQWKAEAVILDAMFFINTKPLRNMVTLSDYATFLFNRFLLPHYQLGVNEVHMLFDTPGDKNRFNPKLFEQKRRDNKGCTTHEHVAFTPSTRIATLSWSSYIACRKCKRSIIDAVGLSFMQSVRHLLRPGQTVYMSGCFGNDCTLQLTGHELPSPALRYKTNSVEADMRIWRHVAQTHAARVLVYSPDTDIYNIGLSIFDRVSDKDIFVQLNVPHSQTQLYLHLNNLITALQRDPDLANIDPGKLAEIFQMLYIASGCDYVSYFAGQGKASFFQAFFQHAAFITGSTMLGSLSDISEQQKSVGFFAFIRLVGTLYFKKHYAAVVSLKGLETPQQLFNGFCNSDPEQNHLEWYNCIRAIVSDRITSEPERMPSPTSMWRHWMRSCWVAHLWLNSPEEDVQASLPSPDNCGWKQASDDSYTVDWESPSVQKQVEDTINFLTKGCSCRGGCLTRRCGCKKNGRHCGPGCQCQNCKNVVTGDREPQEIASMQDHSGSDPSIVHDSASSDEESESDLDSDSDPEREEENIIETEIISDLYDELNNFSIDDI